MRKKVILIIVFVSVISSLLMLIYLGFFNSVEMSISRQPSFHLLYQEHVGPYAKIIHLIDEVQRWAKAQGLVCEKTFGEYLDDPGFVDEKNLRSHGGCLIDLEEKLPSSPLPSPYKIKTLEESEYVIAVFQGSPILGPMRVYPKVKILMDEKKLQLAGPVLEIYELRSPKKKGKITYLFPITR